MVVWEVLHSEMFLVHGIFGMFLRSFLFVCLFVLPFLLLWVLGVFTGNFRCLAYFPAVNPARHDATKRKRAQEKRQGLLRLFESRPKTTRVTTPPALKIPLPRHHHLSQHG